MIIKEVERVAKELCSHTHTRKQSAPVVLQLKLTQLTKYRWEGLQGYFYLCNTQSVVQEPAASGSPGRL